MSGSQESIWFEDRAPHCRDGILAAGIQSMNLQGNKIKRRGLMGFISNEDEIISTYFPIMLSIGKKKWISTRSFTEFKCFNRMLRQDPLILIRLEKLTVEFPKGNDGVNDVMVLLERKEALDDYIQELVNHIDVQMYKPLSDFLRAEEPLSVLSKQLVPFQRRFRRHMSKTYSRILAEADDDYIGNSEELCFTSGSNEKKHFAIEKVKQYMKNLAYSKTPLSRNRRSTRVPKEVPQSGKGDLLGEDKFDEDRFNIYVDNEDYIDNLLPDDERVSSAQQIPPRKSRLSMSSTREGIPAEDEEDHFTHLSPLYSCHDSYTEGTAECKSYDGTSNRQTPVSTITQDSNSFDTAPEHGASCRSTEKPQDRRRHSHINRTKASPVETTSAEKPHGGPITGPGEESPWPMCEDIYGASRNKIHDNDTSPLSDGTWNMMHPGDMNNGELKTHRWKDDDETGLGDIQTIQISLPSPGNNSQMSPGALEAIEDSQIMRL